MEQGQVINSPLPLPPVFPTQTDESLKEIRNLSTRQRLEEFLLPHCTDPQEALHFAGYLWRRPDLRELASEPVLLMELLQIYKSRTEITEDPFELYRQLLSKLLERDEDENAQLKEKRQQFWQRLAYERLFVDQVENHAERLVFGEAEFWGKAQQFFKGDDLAKRFLTDLTDTPLLRKVGIDNYAFIHVRFQEYLAAVALSEREDCEKVFCRSFFDPGLAEMEALPMVVGLAADANKFFSLLESLPESLRLANFRLRARSLSYAAKVEPAHLKRLMEFLGVFVGASNKQIQDTFLKLLYPADESLSLYKLALEFYRLAFSQSAEDKKSYETLGGVFDKESRKQMTRPPRDRGDSDAEIVFGSFSRVRTSYKEQIAAFLIELFEQARKVTYDRFEQQEIRKGITEALAFLGSEKSDHFLLSLLKAEDRALSIMTVFFLGKAGRDEFVEVLIDALLYQKGAFWLPALALEENGSQRAKEGLLTALQSDMQSVRWWAAHGLKKFNDDGVVRALLQALHDSDNTVRYEAIRSLGVIRDESAVEPLIEILTSSDSQLRFTSATALGEIGGAKATQTLTNSLKSEDEGEQAGAAFALGEKGDERAIAVLFQLIKKSDHLVRYNAAETLAKIGGEKVVAGLLQLLYDENPYISRVAARGLARTGDPRALAELIEALHANDRYLRLRVALELGEAGDSRATDVLLDELETAKDNDRKEVVEALAQIGHERAVEELLAAASRQRHFSPKSALELLTQMPPQTLAKGLLRSLSSENSQVRQIAVEVTPYYSDSELVFRELARLSVTDPLEEIREAARKSLEKYFRRLQYLGEDFPSLVVIEDASREKVLEETREFIAHEVKSAIGPLRMVAQLLDEELAHPEINRDKLAAYTKRILTQTDAAYEVVNQYVNYTRPLRPEFTAEDLNQLVGDCLKEISAEGEHHVIEFILQLNLSSKVMIDRAMVTQVLRNVLLNAIESIERDGTLTIVTYQEKDRAVISIRDTGTGIRPEHLDHLFELGFTTKPGKRGAGIGLALSRRLIDEAHKGRIRIHNNTDRPGATVTIELPITQEGRMNGR